MPVLETQSQRHQYVVAGTWSASLSSESASGRNRIDRNRVPYASSAYSANTTAGAPADCVEPVVTPPAPPQYLSLFNAAPLHYAPAVAMKLVPADVISDSIALTGVYERHFTNWLVRIARNTYRRGHQFGTAQLVNWYARPRQN